MVDVRLPERWLTDATFMGLTDTGWRVFTNALMWSCQQQTDGRFPPSVLGLLCLNGKGDAAIHELIEAGLVELVQNGDFQVRNWSDTQTTAEELKKRREANRRRKAESRERKKEEEASHDDVTNESRVTPKARQGEAKARQGEAIYENQQQESGHNQESATGAHETHHDANLNWPVAPIPSHEPDRKHGGSESATADGAAVHEATTSNRYCQQCGQAIYLDRGDGMCASCAGVSAFVPSASGESLSGAA